MIPIKPARQKAFVKLLDDENHGIRRGLLEAFREHGDSATEFLTGIVEKDRNGLGKHARFFLRELGAINTVSDFREFIESLNYELETGFLMLERTIYANREVEDYQLLLDEMASRVEDLGLKPAKSSTAYFFTTSSFVARKRIFTIRRIACWEQFWSAVAGYRLPCP
jgi:hypothetical protein